MGMFGLLLSLLAPPVCAACGDACSPDAGLCPGCRARLAGAPSARAPAIPGLDDCWAAGPYDGVLRDLVTSLKFRALLPVADAMAGLVACGAPPELLAGTLVPVPAAPARRRRRGFDPALEIARALSRRTGLPLSSCLQRADGPRQVGRPRSARRSDPPRVACTSSPPASALLVDDVMTTGATLSTCAAALRAGGSTRVAAVTVALTTRQVSDSSVRVLGAEPNSA